MARAPLRARRRPPRFTVAEFRSAAPGRALVDAAARAICRAPGAALVALLALSLACSEQDPRTLEDYIGRVEWFPTMRRQPSVEPYEEELPRLPPEGALPVDAEPGPSLVEAEKIRTSPAPPTPESLARGKARYDIFCAVCHGPEGSGEGNIATVTGFPAGLIPDLTADRAVGLTDGYLYGIILNGRGLMPSYRRVPRDERWDIVNYVRSLQGKATPASGPEEE